jgi:Methylase involved in ubiquinone/menaquinone biosynthesis
MFKSILYNEKSLRYFNNFRRDLADLIPCGKHRVLDVGCGSGFNLVALREMGKAERTFGVEINGSIPDNFHRELDRVFIGDVESMELPIEEKYFDYIIFGDVLEHLIDPGMVLKKYARYLKDDGFVVASIPNLKHYLVLSRLVMFDEFRYADSGLLDRSHLRFFTKKEIYRMFQSENLEIIAIRTNLWLPLRLHDNKLLAAILRRLPGSSFISFQYLVKARKKMRQEEV